VTIVRVGLGETKDFAAGYDALFKKKKTKPIKRAKTARITKAKKQSKGK
jgi:hypothetical protein